MEEIQEAEELKIPDVLPLLPVRDVVVFPYIFSRSSWGARCR